MFDTDDNDLDEFDGDLPKKLRKQLDAALKTIKEQERTLAEMQAATHSQSIASMLSGYGLNPEISQFVHEDVQSEAELEAWLDQFGHLFGVEAVDETPAYAEDADASYLMNQVEEGGIDPQVGFDLEQRILNAKSPEEILAIVQGAN